MSTVSGSAQQHLLLYSEACTALIPHCMGSTPVYESHVRHTWGGEHWTRKEKGTHQSCTYRHNDGAGLGKPRGLPWRWGHRPASGDAHTHHTHDTNGGLCRACTGARCSRCSSTEAVGERPCPATQQLTADPRGVGTQRLQRGPLWAGDTRPDVQLGVALLVVRRVVLPAEVWV